MNLNTAEFERDDTDPEGYKAGLARVLMFSAVKHPAGSVYPDGDKIGIYTDPDRTDNIRIRRESGVDSYDREV